MTFKEILKQELSKWETARNNNEYNKADEIKINFFRIMNKKS